MSAGRKIVSEKKDWNTPPKYIKLIEQVLGDIELDPCSNQYSMVNAKRKIILPENGLIEKWDAKTIFVNPPYGKDVVNKTSISSWIQKGIEAFQNGSELLYLIPVATNTSHFKQMIFKYATGICFLEDTRLKFWTEGVEYKKGAPMSCCMVYFGANYETFETVFNTSGKCFKIK